MKLSEPKGIKTNVNLKPQGEESEKQGKKWEETQEHKLERKETEYESAGGQ